MIRGNKYIFIPMLLCVAVTILYGCTDKSSTVIYPVENTERTTEESGVKNLDSADSEVMDKEISETTEICEVYVQICGEVKMPGVYKTSSDMRIFQVIELAGGVTEDADISAVNMARPVVDEMNIYIPAAGEAVLQEMSDIDLDSEQQTANGNFDNKKININTASKEELMTLNGIGEIKSEAIISYRQEIGRFTDISQIMNISGIKEAAFNKIKDYITVE